MRTFLARRRQPEAESLPPRAQWVLISAITALAAAIRLIGITGAGFRIDEGFTLICSRQSWAGVIGLHGYYSLHPPLFFTMVKAANLILPEVYSARAIAVAAGIATIPVFFLLVRRLVDARVALGAALLLAVSPLHVEFSRDGRMYTPVFFLATLGWLGLVGYIQTRQRFWAIVFGATLVLSMYIDYSAIFAAAPQGVVLLVYLVSVRGQAPWLIGAVAGAVLAYVPWLPQIYRGVERSSDDPGRASFLAASWDRINGSVLSLLGFAGRTVTFGGKLDDAWRRWPELHWPFMLIALAALAVGVLALRRIPVSLGISAIMILVPPVTAIAVSQVSPGYAPRTIMASLLGLTTLASAFLIQHPMPRLLRIAGAVGWIFLAVMSISSLPSTREAGARSEWPAIAQDLAEQRAMRKPILIFSTAGMLTDMIDMYAGEKLAGVRIITLQDGEREKTIGYHRWAKRGLSLAEIRDGALDRELDPADPTADAVWVILRFGGNQVAARLERLGYEQIGAFRYTDTVLYLYARPGAVLGQPVPVDSTFTESLDQVHGWQITSSRARVEPAGLADSAARQIVMTQDRGRARYIFAAPQGGLVTAELDVRVHAGGEARVVLRCESASGESLDADDFAFEPAPSADGWQPLRAAILCPEATTRASVTLERRGPAEVAFRDLNIQFNPDDVEHD